MARLRGRAFLVLMKRHDRTSDDRARMTHEEPAKDPRRWKVAMPLQTGGKAEMGAGEEWRPGERARRGRERAESEWWWI
jgi:hypothetical protein